MTKACDGIHRTDKGDRLMIALVTDDNTTELRDTLAAMRGAVPAYAGLTDEDLRNRLVELIAKIPKKCPKCDGDKE